MTTLTLSGKHMHSLYDIYNHVVAYFHLDVKNFGYNLDALGASAVAHYQALCV